MIPFWDDHEGDHSLRMKDMSEVRRFGKWSMELAWSSLYRPVVGSDCFACGP